MSAAISADQVKRLNELGERQRTLTQRRLELGVELSLVDNELVEVTHTLATLVNALAGISAIKPDEQRRQL